jgi:hypothetical protein
MNELKENSGTSFAHRPNWQEKERGFDAIKRRSFYRIQSQIVYDKFGLQFIRTTDAEVRVAKLSSRQTTGIASIL